jgi:carboxy-cis,cis-muconate cyclase
MYDINDDGSAYLLCTNLSPELGDGSRNSFPSEDGKLLYVVKMVIDRNSRFARLTSHG